jgi:hypothetical protein
MASESGGSYVAAIKLKSKCGFHAGRVRTSVRMPYQKVLVSLLSAVLILAGKHNVKLPDAFIWFRSIVISKFAQFAFFKKHVEGLRG